MRKEYYSTAEVAALLNVTRVTVFRQIKAGKLVAMKIGRNYVVPKSSLVEVLGDALGEKTKRSVDRAIEKAIEDYGDTFKKLAKE